MLIQCDKCERDFDVPAGAAGTKVPCPFCGDINRVPAAEAEAAPAANAARMERQQSAAPKHKPEKTICTIRPAMFRAHPFKYAGLVLLVIAGVVLMIWSQASERAWPWLIWPGMLVAAVSAVWFGAWWMVVHYWTKLVVSNKRTIRQEGIIKRHTTEVLHDHVRSVDIQQSLMERILGVGTVGIDSAGQDSVEIVMKDIPKPYEVKKVIDKYRKM